MNLNDLRNPKYIVCVAGAEYCKASTKERAEMFLEEAKNSYLSKVHCAESFYIKEV